MDISDILATLEWFSEEFPAFEGSITHGSDDRYEWCIVGFRFQELLVIVAILRGPRGAITEQVIAVDPTRKIEADRPFLSCVGKSLTTAIFVDHYAVKKAIAAGESFQAIAARHLEGVTLQATNNPAGFRSSLHRAQLYTSYVGRFSIKACRG